MGVRVALLSMIVSRVISLLVMLVSIAALGRLLDAEAFGHFAVLIPIFALAKTLSEFGLRSYLVRTREISGRDLAEATGLSVAIAAGLAILWLGAAWGLPSDIVPRAQALAVVPLALALLLAALNLGTEVRLQRDIDFGLISRIEVGRVVADASIAIALASLGFGVTALAWGFFSGHLAYSGVILLRGSAGGRIWPRMGGWRAYSGFGARITTTQILPPLGDIAVAATVTALLGAATMGLLNRAQTIQKIMDRTLFEGILPVVLPAMSAALARGVPPIDIYTRQIKYLVAICWPGFAAIALLAEPLVMVLLGEDWSAAIPGVRLLAFAGLGLPFTKMSAKFFIAMGLEQPYLRISVAMQVVRVALVLFASLVSFEMVCLAISVATCWKAADVGRAIRRDVGPMGPDRSSAALQGAALSIAALAGPAFALWLDLSALATLVIALPLAVLGWAAALFAVSHPLADELRGVIAELRRWRRR